jgi:hypothetical protein
VDHCSETQGGRIEMSILGDAQELYQSVGSTWRRRRSHILAHIILASITFGLCGATIPRVTLPAIDAGQIMGDPWYKLAKDSGMIYLALFIPFLIFGAYVSIISTLGGFLAILLRKTFPVVPSSLFASPLERIALLLDRENVNLYEVNNKVEELWLEFRLRKFDVVTSFEQQALTKVYNASTYLGDFALFACLWVLFFVYFPNNAWIAENRGHFWSVLLIVSFLIWLARRYGHRMLGEYIALRPYVVSEAILSDDALKQKVAATREERDRVLLTLDKLLKAEAENVRLEPTLINLVVSRIPQFLIDEFRRMKRSVEGSYNHRNPVFFTNIDNGGRDLSMSEWLVLYFSYRTWLLQRGLRSIIRSFWNALLNLV